MFQDVNKEGKTKFKHALRECIDHSLLGCCYADSFMMSWGLSYPQVGSGLLETRKSFIFFSAAKAKIKAAFFIGGTGKKTPFISATL